ncbi:MAG: hypothetical protein O2818_05410 [Bacteroidetes bacterium]|nr:hypothetical protein [Bacteroidota bacterium]MDA1336309.1 hypothetical protein [Bacteroidota bacterium]
MNYRFAPWLSLFLGSLLFVGCKEESSIDPYKKLKPFEAQAWKWSYPDNTWDPMHAGRMLDEVHRWKSLQQSESGNRMINGEWRLEGPTNIGGRFNFLRQHPTDPNILYAGSSSGGLWKGTGDGDWVPLTDDFPAMAMGDLAFYPGNPERLFLATGDPQISSFPRMGNGVYRSLDGGESWQNIGLDSMGVISKLLFVPSPSNDSQILLAGAMGNPAIPGNNRGLFRSTDSGMNWEQVLLPNDSTGITDILFDAESEAIFAAAWQRTRNSTGSEVWGPHCRIWKSQDAGQSWQVLDNPWESGHRGRIGLASSPNGVYALVVGQDNQLDNLYRTTDGGENWNAVIPQDNIPENALGGFGWYFSKVRINPFDANDITILGVNTWNSLNGGVNWNLMGPEWWTYEVHADKHDLQWIGSETCILATDGGLYKTEDHGLTWNDIDDIPVTQFYRATWNPHNPGIYTGGAQDNGTTTGNFENLDDWSRDLGGDGFTAIFHPTNPALRYAGYQWGNWRFSMTEYDEEPLWNDFTYGIEEDDRVWWDAPLIYHPSNPDEMWTGTQRLYRMDNAPVGVWEPMSDDLTFNTDPGLSYRCVSSIAGSYFDEGTVAAGTTDGRVWITQNYGASWQLMEEGLPGQFVTDIEFSPFNEDSIYCTVSGFRNAIYSPFIYKAAIGSTWESAQGNLPQHPVNQMLNLNDSIWVVATDGGVFATEDYGHHWSPVGSLPTIPVYDIVADTLTNRLVAGTFARSMLSFPLDSILPQVETPPNGISAMGAPFAWNIYPNPFAESITITWSKPVQTCIVYDDAGRMIYRKNNLNSLPVKRLQIVTSNWAAANYTVQCISTDGTAHSAQAIKLRN